MGALAATGIAIGHGWRLIPDIDNIGTRQEQIKHILLALAFEVPQARRRF